MDQRVTLDVDGEERTVRAFDADVREVLDSEGVELGEHDAVAPAPDTDVSSGDTILVRTGREFVLELDGEPETYWVTALTVGEALDQIGLGDETLEMSVGRDEPVPESGIEVEATGARQVAILNDRTRAEVATTAGTVEEVLADNGVELGEHDIVEPDLDTEPTDGMVIDVLEVLGEPETRETEIEAETERRETDELEKGEEEVVQEPEDGLKEVTVATVMEEGEETEHVLEEEVLEEPVDGVVEVGTKEPEENVGGEADNLNWDALAECESGGDPTAVNSAGGYYGLYQFSMASWESVGGSGSPAEASPAEQTMRAKKLYNAVDGNWQGQWPECGSNLFN
ncbi:resuscitation-promoting factor [Halostreptopolyspora alba]|uniref:Resuscitation-promoting factor n=2 Tax=Halostreptopolyspora alba TaxID=2487137 RepID=A0A3N0E4Y2_9ACTN|nr:resuscitation-promoting factor [Nocardiopsaceae bacterium YIM 96095]